MNITDNKFTALEAIAELLMWAGYDYAADAIYARIEAENGDLAPVAA